MSLVSSGVSSPEHNTVYVLSATYGTHCCMESETDVLGIFQDFQGVVRKARSELVKVLSAEAGQSLKHYLVEESERPGISETKALELYLRGIPDASKYFNIGKEDGYVEMDFEEQWNEDKGTGTIHFDPCCGEIIGCPSAYYGYSVVKKVME